ncbi:MAG: glucose-6-phosphate isomerase, partial [Candidatus Cryosericum sp.]
MDELIHLDDSWARGDFGRTEMDTKLGEALLQLRTLVGRTGVGADFAGWLDLPVTTPESVLKRIEEVAASLRCNSDVVVLCGIGGSYLGARAGIEFLDDPSDIPGRSTRPDIVFAGNSLSSQQLRGLMSRLADRRFSVVVISKSGTT